MNNEPILLTGLNGSNPLAFLAALGTLRAAGGDAALSWQTDLVPLLHLNSPLTVEELTQRIAAALRQARACLNAYPTADRAAEIIKTETSLFRRFAAAGMIDPLVADFAAAFASEACTDQSDQTLVSPTRLSLANANGGKKLLLQFRSMIDDAPEASETPESTELQRSKSKKPRKAAPVVLTIAQLVQEALFDWTPRDGNEFYSFRWDPAELRRYAHMAVKPEDDKYRPVPAANLLAVLGLSLLPSAPTLSGLQTSGMFEFDEREFFAWPLWTNPLSAAAVRSLLLQPGHPEATFAPSWSRHRGVFVRYATERFTDPQKNAYFAPAVAV